MREPLELLPRGECQVLGGAASLHALPPRDPLGAAHGFLVELCRVGSVGWQSHDFMEAVYGRTHLGVNFTKENVGESHRLYEQHLSALLYGGAVDSERCRDLTVATLPDIKVFAMTDGKAKEGRMEVLLEQRRAEMNRLCEHIALLIGASSSPAPASGPLTPPAAAASGSPFAAVAGGGQATAWTTAPRSKAGGGAAAASKAKRATSAAPSAAAASEGSPLSDSAASAPLLATPTTATAAAAVATEVGPFAEFACAAPIATIISSAMPPAALPPAHATATSSSSQARAPLPPPSCEAEDEDDPFGVSDAALAAFLSRP